MMDLYSTLQHAPIAFNQALLPLARNAKADDIAALAAFGAASIAFLTRGRLWSIDPYRYQLFERPQQLFAKTSAARQTRNVAELLEKSSCEVAILWASQSGTAERFATRLAKDLKHQLKVNVIVVDMSDVDPASIVDVPASKLAIFLASTYGEGEPPDNMHEFWTWLEQASDPPAFNLRYMCFGLGNSNYKYYNLVIETLDHGLSRRGAHALLPTGKADDADGETEENFLEWKQQVLDTFHRDLGYTFLHADYSPSLHIVADESLDEVDLHLGSAYPSSHQTSWSKIHDLPIAVACHLFSAKDQRRCIHMEFDLTDPTLKYRTGDHIGIWPVNPSEEVERLIKVLGLEEQRGIPQRVKAVDDVPVKVPSPTTINALFEHYLEICAVLSREHVDLLAFFASSEECKQTLEAISSSKTAYAQYLRCNYLTLGRLLERTGTESNSWKNLPLAVVIEILRPMQPRYYSISSSSVVSGRRVAITAVVADSTVPATGEHIPGLATNYLMGAMPDSSKSLALTAESMPSPPVHQTAKSGYIHAHIRRSTFKLPTLASAPIVMVGAGTGIAPFRGFVQERARLATTGRPVGPTMLFFGCRHPDLDNVYHDEFAELGRQLGECFDMHTAFSRPTNGEAKRYVQDCIDQETEAVYDLLFNQNAYLYICGSAAMARDVLRKVMSIIQQQNKWDDARAAEFVQTQKRTRRWLQDVWG